MTIDSAIIWDYDGTLVDTWRKNWQVTRALIEEIGGRPLATLGTLATLEAYQAANKRSANWRELYGKELGLSAEQVDQAGRLWTRYQLADQTPAPLFNGVAQAVQALEHLPQAIFSQNSRQAIMAALEANGLARFISLVVGYEEVGFERQKPAPDGLLVCIERLGIRPGTVFYVGDHDTDVLCAERANRALMASGAGMKIVSIRAAFGDAEPGSWGHEPDFVAERPEEVVEIVSGSEEARR